MKLTALSLACLLLLPLTAWAGNFNYDYAELYFQHSTPQVGESSKGPTLDLSYTMTSMGVQLLAGYASLDTPATPTEINNHNYWLGLRGENSFGDSTDFYTDILYLNDQTNAHGNTSTTDGYRLVLGLRQQIIPQLEFDGSLAHDYLAQSNNEAAIGLLFNATSYLAVGISYAHDSLHNNTSMLRLRVYY
ncbi:MAG TPA: hypothetical protein VFK12_05120 [Gammaproteobacteria bacterium]|nr:hypothetical protein [Gammaproteobacteria bacterium]